MILCLLSGSTVEDSFASVPSYRQSGKDAQGVSRRRTGAWVSVEAVIEERLRSPAGRTDRKMMDLRSDGFS